LLHKNINIEIPLIPKNGKLPIISKIADTNFNNLSMLRLDEIHPILAGNKWFKIKNAIAYCLQHNLKGIISFGGNYSNHLHALSHACSLYNLQSIGIVNGFKNELLQTPTIQDALSYGMQLHLGGFNAYKKTPADLAILLPTINLNDFYIMPMGGNDALSILGAQDIYDFIPATTNEIWVSAGSGTTALALYNKMPTHQTLHIVTPFKQNDMLQNLFNKANVKIHNFNLAGNFGKQNEALVIFINSFNKKHHIMLDHVYTSNMMFFLFEYYKEFQQQQIMAIHTGGLQGNRAFK
jgi:1-aminocyclopropane-1-carboxylate deaminase